MITKAAIERIIRAARKASRISFHIHALSSGSSLEWTEADEISSLLIDALVLMTEGSMMNVNGIQLKASERRDYLRKELNDVVTTPDKTNADKLAYTIAQGIAEVQQPAPNIITRESFDEMWKKAGGYLYKAVTEKAVAEDDPGRS